jgi:transcriptional regulator with XRE-family HTH domain
VRYAYLGNNMDQSDINIRELREELGWKRSRLARYLGVDLSMVSRIENGSPTSGSVQRLIDILAAAKVAGTADALCPENSEAAE